MISAVNVDCPTLTQPAETNKHHHYLQITEEQHLRHPPSSPSPVTSPILPLAATLPFILSVFLSGQSPSVIHCVDSQAASNHERKHAAVFGNSIKYLFEFTDQHHIWKADSLLNFRKFIH